MLGPALGTVGGGTSGCSAQGAPGSGCGAHFWPAWAGMNYGRESTQGLCVGGSQAQDRPCTSRCSPCVRCPSFTCSRPTRPQASLETLPSPSPRWPLT